MKQSYHILRQIIFFAAIAVMIFAVVFMLLSVYHDARSRLIGGAERGWELVIDYPDAQEYDNVDLDSFKITRPLKRGETLTLKRRFTEDETRGMIMRIYTRQSAIRVSVDGEEIYSYGFSEYDDGRFVGTGYHFVVLPNSFDKEGEEIVMEIVCCEDGGVTGLPMLWLTRQEVTYTAFLGGQVATVAASVFLFMLGTIVSVITLWYLSLDREFFPLVMVGFLSLFMGLWGMLSCGMLRIFDVDISFNNALEYGIMYLCVMPLLLLGTYQKREQKGPRIRMEAAITVMAIFYMVAFILHEADIVHVVRFNVIFESFVVIVFILLMFDDKRKRDELMKSDRIFKAAMLVGAGFIAAEILRFQLFLHVFRNIRLFEISLLPFGTLVFVLLLLYAYLSLMLSRRMDRAEKEALKNLAYSDRLTGLSNRARSSVIFSELDRGHEPYAILNFDLNGLKKTNDTHGHAAGDMLISAFASILRESVREIGEAVRMSGDEFIVVLTGKRNVGKAELVIDDIKHHEASESKKLGMDVDASYGVAKSTEVMRPRAEQIYRMADERMYKMKVASKKGRTS